MATGETLGIHYSYLRASLAAEQVRQISLHLEQLLEHMLALVPIAAVGELQLVTATERQQLVDDWNCRDTRFSTTTPIHQLIQAQALRAPDAVALMFAEE
ncbi:hypothetical protein, partial [Mycobacterium avium]|uniref:hypothetical protein n=1 Tax=Mycobacterium avium TaxID=1764 RepID=UPI00113073A3